MSSLHITLAVLITAPALAAEQDTAARLKVFEREVRRAAHELRIARPVVHVVSSEEAQSTGANPLVAAWVWVPEGTDSRGVPRYVRGEAVQLSIVWFQLMGASDARLRCWARHEMTHVALGHEFGALSPREAVIHHDLVRHFMEARWRQDSACLIP